MGFFDAFKNTAQSAKNTAAAASPAAAAANKSETFTYSALPKNLAELKAMPGADLTNPFAVSALCMAVLAHYEENTEETIEMLNYLKGPEPVNPYQKQFLRDRLGGKMYVIRSYFAGTSPDNNYTPTVPYTISIAENPHSYEGGENYVTLHMQSSGADAPRQIRLRKKPSTGQWFVNELLMLSDIRTPKEADPWA
ncbi:MAG TPA: hypothetical protein O0X70_06090 [Methanocorpusculum sp.]|nr:hypothetical protein [Methanocorpusculum sp.]